MYSNLVKVFIASSHRNYDLLREVSATVQNIANHSVFNFSDDSGRLEKTAFLKTQRSVVDPSDGLDSYLAQLSQWNRILKENLRKLRECDICVLVLPAGLDAHCDWAYAKGHGATTILFGLPEKEDTAQWHSLADFYVSNVDDLRRCLCRGCRWLG
jgi:hypothetical protein